jgi:DHA1 family bicyclomycin/chloramphenicol resistance-like MFS transporter
LSTDTYLPALPRVVAELHTSSWAVQLSLSTSLVGLALGQLLAGPASDRHGRRPVVLVGCCGFAVSSVLCAITPDVALLVLFRLAQGGCGAAGIVVSRAIVRDLYSGSDLGRIFSRLMLVSGAAPIVAPIVGAQLLRLMGWRGVFWMLAVIGLLVLSLTFVVVPETLAREDRVEHTLRADLHIYRRIMRDRGFLPYMLSSGMFSGVLFSFISGSSFVVQKVYDHSATIFSFLFAAVTTVMIGLGQINARLVRTRSLERLTRTAMSVSAVGSLGVILVATVGASDGIWLFLVALIVAVSPNGVVGPNSNALAMQDYKANAGAAAALMGVSMFLVGGLVAPLVGVAGEHTAVPLGIVMATCASSALVLLITLGRRGPVTATDGSSELAALPDVPDPRPFV